MHTIATKRSCPSDHTYIGVIAAVLGVETQSGDFEVVDICFAGMAQQTSPATSIDGSSDEQDTYVAIVSGLEMGINDAPADFRTGLLVEWLLGECGSEDVSGASSSRVSLD